MASDRLAGTREVRIRVAFAQIRSLFDREATRDVARQGIVCGSLVRYEIEVLGTPSELGNDLGRVAEEPDRQGAALTCCRANACKRVVERASDLVEVTGIESSLDPCGVDLDAENRGAGHGGGQGLRAPHATEAGRQDRPAGQVGRAEMALAGCRKGLVGALQDALGADVDPRAG